VSAPTETLPQLAFAVEGAETLPFAAMPTIAFRLRVESDTTVRAIALNAQIRIVPSRRGYDEDDQRRLTELFGAPEQWGETLRGFLWTHASVQVPPFSERTTVALHVPCTYDLEVAAAKYLHALGDGEVPLELLFSGTIFYGDGFLRTAQIPWDREAEYRLPVHVWRETMETYFPNSAWLRLHRDVFDRLVAYKAARALPSWDAVASDLLEGRE